MLIICRVNSLHTDKVSACVYRRYLFGTRSCRISLNIACVDLYRIYAARDRIRCRVNHAKLTGFICTPCINLFLLGKSEHEAVTNCNLSYILQVVVIVLIYVLMRIRAICKRVRSITLKYLNRCCLILSHSTVTELALRVVTPCPYSTVTAESRACVAHSIYLYYIVEIVLCADALNLNYRIKRCLICGGIVTELTVAVITPCKYPTLCRKGKYVVVTCGNRYNLIICIAKSINSCLEACDCSCKSYGCMTYTFTPEVNLTIAVNSNVIIAVCIDCNYIVKIDYRACSCVITLLNSDRNSCVVKVTAALICE